jgi:SWI/SNF-related matrix-associated actin-dependent regulator of chromatin subfamily A-like protein 1
MQYFILENINEKLKDILKKSIFGVVLSGRYSLTIPMYGWASALRLASIHDKQTFNRMTNAEDYSEARKYADWLEDNYKNRSITNSDLQLTKPVILPPRDYQRSAVERILSFYDKGFHGHLLADEMGVGKTASALFSHSELELPSCLVITPSHLKYNAASEWDKFIPNNNSFIMDSKTKEKDIFWKNNIIVNYDILDKFKDILTQKRFYFIICDEAHYLANPKSLRSKAVKQISANCEFILLLTGTPRKGYNRNLRNLLSLIDPDGAWDNWKKYSEYFCDLKRNRYGWDDSGESNMRSLNKILYSCYATRRLKSQVLTELPEKSRTFIEVDIESTTLKKSKKIFKDWNGWETFESLPPEFKNDKEYQSLKKEIGSGKIKASGSMIEEMLESGPLVVFAYHREVVKELTKKMGGAKKVSQVIGGMNAEVKQEEVDKFLTGVNDLIILSIGSGAEGLTLVNASQMLIVELDDRADKLQQAEDRIHRDGQESKCNIIYLIAKGTIDEYMAGRLKRKIETDEKVV